MSKYEKDVIVKKEVKSQTAALGRRFTKRCCQIDPTYDGHQNCVNLIVSSYSLINLLQIQLFEFLTFDIFHLVLPIAGGG